MNRNRTARFCLFSSLCTAVAAGAADLAAVWEIGRADRSGAEFALAPGGYDRFGDDPVFVVGASTPAADWPYAHPAPQDAWAGNRPHTFTILFGLAADPAGPCRLRLTLADTHPERPPRVEMAINGRVLDTRDLPAGGAEESIKGQFDRGRPCVITVDVPAGTLRSGGNAVTLTTEAGSWFVYDHVALEGPAGTAVTPLPDYTAIQSVRCVRALREENDALVHPIRVTILHSASGPATETEVLADGRFCARAALTNGVQTVELAVPAVTTATTCVISLTAGGREVASRGVDLGPVPRLTVYVLPHSHTDIGYTHLQTEIEQRQVQNLVDGLAAARRTADYPAGSRFVWNVEVLWAADLYLRRLDDAKRAELIDAVRSGQVALQGMYLNELTGLCRPEELLQLFRFATRMSQRCGAKVDAAMISDVPGYTWGTVTAMAHAGIRYFSVAPNYFDRIGTILREWENKPFWWVGPDGSSRVLVWIPFWGYAMSHRYDAMSERLVGDFLEGLAKREYPYDIAYVRWSGHGDNAVPEPQICDFIRDWNARYAWPRFVIASTRDAFRAFEKRYGATLPEVRGDWTPYWEDGAGSSAAETALNRTSAERLQQAAAVWALGDPRSFPAAEFEDAWNFVLLYSEHTWGAHCSVTKPEDPFTRDQWVIKQGYALEAARRTSALLDRALGAGTNGGGAAPDAVDVFNTESWPRSGLVTWPKGCAAPGDTVLDDRGRPAPSQRLASGELVFLARDVPTMAARRYRATTGPASAPPDEVRVSDNTLDNGRVRVRLNGVSGDIVELGGRRVDGNLADATDGEALNRYLYLMGDNPTNAVTSGTASIRVGERGPLVASLVVTSDAPGCRRLVREIRLAAGSDHAEILNTVDKARLVAEKYRDFPAGKESVNFAFPFRVPGGQMRVDIPFAIFRPETDQMPSACKNWLTAGRWVDVSGPRGGVTWATLDAPLFQAGGLTATLLDSQSDPGIWRKAIEPTQTVVSWVMNNHWGTNYRAYQEGVVVFRYALRPHGGYDAAEATRFGIERSRPLLVRPAVGPAPSGRPRFVVSGDGVLVESWKPSDDGRGLIIRLFNAGDRATRAAVSWSAPAPAAVYLTALDEEPRAKAGRRIELPPHGLVSLRAEW